MCNLSHCDFIWTKLELVVQRITKDQDFLLETMSKAPNAFIQIPERLTRQNDPSLESLRCSKQCGGPPFGKIIECVTVDVSLLFTAALQALK